MGLAFVFGNGLWHNTHQFRFHEQIDSCYRKSIFDDVWVVPWWWQFSTWSVNQPRIESRIKQWRPMEMTRFPFGRAFCVTSGFVGIQLILSTSFDQIFVETPYSLKQSMTVKSHSLLLPTEAILVPATKVYTQSIKETTVPYFAMLSSWRICVVNSARRK